MMMDDPKKTQIFFFPLDTFLLFQNDGKGIIVAFLKLDRVRVTDEQYYAKCPLTNKSRTAVFIHASFSGILIYCG